jgi:hypothetical protein
MIFKDCGSLESALTYEQALSILSNTIMDLKDMTHFQRVRDPDRDKIRIERYKILIDLCIGYCYLLIFHDIVKLRSDLHEITIGGAP